MVVPEGNRRVFGARAEATAGRGTLWYGPGDRLELSEYETEGSLRRVVRLDRPARMVTETAISAYETTMLSSVRAPRSEPAVRRFLESTTFPDTLPSHGRLLVDAADNLWVQEYAVPGEAVAARWSVFDPTGRFLGDVSTPRGVTVLEIGADYVLGLWRDDLEVERVSRFDLVKPGAS